MANYYFLRHGESTANVDRVVAGWSEVPLTEEGVRQACVAADAIDSNGITFDLIISSSLSRAHDTAVIVARRLAYPESDIEHEPGLREKSGGSFELLSIDTFYTLSEADLIAGGGENAEMFRARVIEVMKAIKDHTQYSRNVLLVGHAGFYKMVSVIVKRGHPTSMYEASSPPNARLLPFPLEEALIAADQAD